MQDLRYPIGRYQPPDPIAAAHVSQWIDTIAATPAQLRAAVAGLADAQLDTPYRPDGWTVRQVIHHIADSHLNSILRFKWALTEDNPTIKTYDEQAWALLPDYRLTPPETSLALLDHLHARWVVLLRALDEAALQRPFVHPDLGPLTVAWNIGLYAWHGPHHIAHITALRARQGW